MRQLRLTLGGPARLRSDEGARGHARSGRRQRPGAEGEPVPVVGVAQVEVGAVRVGIAPWVRVSDVVAAEGLYKALAERFQTAGIGIPLPRQEIRLLNGTATAA